MKNLKLFTLALIISSSSLFAAKTQMINLEIDQIKEHLSDLFQTSKILAEKGMVLNVLFTFDSEGELVVYKADTKKNSPISSEDENLNKRKTIIIKK